MARQPTQRTASRYQRGLSYEPGMAESRYRPERATGGGGAPVTGVGGGINPIPTPVDDGGVTVTPVSGGSGLGGAALGGAGLLAALANPTLIRQLGGLLGGSGAGAVTGVTQGSTALGGAAPAAGAAIEPVAALAPEAATQGATSGLAGVGTAGGAGAAGGGLAGIQPYTAPVTPGSSLSGFSTGTGLSAAGGGAVGSGLAGIQNFWEYGMAAPGTPTSGFSAGGFGLGSGLESGVMDGGGLGAEALGAELAGDGAASAFAGGSFLANAPWNIAGAALGNYISSQAPFEGSRVSTGKDIGAAVGALAGMAIPIPFFGPLLGSILGGAIGGQFGPQESVGANWNAGFTWSPEMARMVNNAQAPITDPAQLGQFGWSYGGGADNGGVMNNDFANAFQQQLLQMAAQRGYQVNPLAVGAGYAVGQFTGDSMTAPGQGYFYKAANDYSANPSQFFGTDLNAQYQPFGGVFAGAFDHLMPQSNMTVGQQMLNYAFDDLVNQGLFTQGPVVSQDAALQQLLGTSATNAQNYQTNFANAQDMASVG